MRRLISDAVQVKPPLPAAIYTDETIDPGVALRAHLPTEAETRDAVAKLVRQMQDTVAARTAGQEGWVVGDLEVSLVNLDMGEVAVRGSVIIERSDA